MTQRLTTTLLAAAALLGGAVQASAQTMAPGVRLTDGVYHKAVCKGPVAPLMARCFAHVVTDAAGTPKPGKASGDSTPSGFGPTDLRSAYATSGSLGSSSTTIALVDAFGYTNAESDLAVYRAQFGLPPCTTANGCFGKYNQNGQMSGYPSQNIGWAQESALDLDMASAMCPNCKIILVEANTSSFANLAAAENTAASLGAHVISNSYGGAESGSTPYEPSYNHAGLAITASTGDSAYGAGPQFPSSSPHVTAVGGTTLKKASKKPRGWKETAWSDGGSGCSTVYAKPSWQHDPGCSMRMEADVAAVANPSTGVAVYGPNGSGVSTWLVFGGTSVAAPLIGGVYGANGGSVTYGSNPYANTGALNDITKGGNGSCTPAYFCHAEVGYDGPTGLGTPIGVTAF